MPLYERPSELPEYGFEAPVYVNPTDYIDFKNGYTDTLNHRRSRWAEQFSRKSIARGRKLKRFCRKGIPPASRPEIWMMVSGAKSRMEASPGLYIEALSKEPDKKIMSVILADLPRTFPENVFFKNFTDPESKLPSLKRVLVAFAAQFPKVGYCQGFNYITAMLLLVLRGSPEANEERAFWLLDALINHLLPPYYSDDMVSVRRDCMVLGDLIKLRDPALNSIVVNSGVNYTTLCAKWFICLYADVLPIETTMRIFDCLFYEGDKILFRAGFALIRLHRNHLLQCDEFPALLTTFRSMCQDKQTLWCHEFLQAMFTLPGNLSRKTIEELRQSAERRVLEENSS